MLTLCALGLIKPSTQGVNAYPGTQRVNVYILRTGLN